MKIEHLIFDMDNTLYPACGAMDTGISRRMLEGISEFFNISLEEAAKVRKENIANHSTTLEWLMSAGLTDTEWWFKKVHPQNEADELVYDPKLRPFLQSIPLPKVILTNAPSEHADRVLEKLNVRDCFDFICDIRFSGMKGKPYPQAFQRALDAARGNIDDTLFLDDLVKYTDGWQSMGGTGVLVGNKHGHHLSPDSPAVFKGLAPHPGRTLQIDSIYNLPELLKTI